MSGFKNNVSDGWLFTQELRLFGNFMRNWNHDVDDCDFFDIFANGNNSNRDEMKTLLKRHFDLERVAKTRAIEVCRVKSAENDKGQISDFSISQSIDEAICAIWNEKPLRSNCVKMLEEWSRRMLRRKTQKRRRKDILEARVDEMCRVLKLDDTERDVLIYSVVRAMSCFDDYPSGGCRRSRHDVELFYAMATDRPVSAVTKAMSADGILRKFEVLDSDGDLCRDPFRNYLDNGDGEMIEGQFYKKTSTDDALPWDYYGKLAEEHGGILRSMISSAKSGKRGVNILFYGEPGTGKTSFAKTLAKELGLDLFEIRQGDRNGEHNSPQSRMAGIRICNEQAPRERSMVVVDEADQLLRTSMDFFASLFGGMGSSGSEKGVINSILDETKLPTIWISNAPARALDDSVRRRFDYSIRFDKLGTRQRLAIWRNSVKKFRLERLVPAELAEQFAQKYQTSAGGIAMVLENVKRMRPRKDKVAALVESLMKPHCELMEAKTKDDALMPTKDYSLDGLNIKGDIALDRIVEAVRNFRNSKEDGNDPDRPRMNILLWGPPGTGKTEFVKHLGKTLNSRVVVKMGSDLLSCWVGETEKNIKRAFFEWMFKTRLGDAEARRLAAIPNLAPGDFRTVRQSLYYLGGSVSNETRLNELEKECSLKKGCGRRIGF